MCCVVFQAIGKKKKIWFEKCGRPNEPTAFIHSHRSTMHGYMYSLPYTAATHTSFTLYTAYAQCITLVHIWKAEESAISQMEQLYNVRYYMIISVAVPAGRPATYNVIRVCLLYKI